MITKEKLDETQRKAEEALRKLEEAQRKLDDLEARKRAERAEWIKKNIGVFYEKKK